MMENYRLCSIALQEPNIIATLERGELQRGGLSERINVGPDAFALPQGAIPLTYIAGDFFFKGKLYFLTPDDHFKTDRGDNLGKDYGNASH